LETKQEDKAKKKQPLSKKQKARNIAVVFLVVMILPRLMLVEYIYDGRTIRMPALVFTGQFAPIRAEADRGDVRILGRHTLETEPGDITLRTWSRITTRGRRISLIYIENFYWGRASHSLKAGGVQLPQTIDIAFNQGRFDRVCFGLSRREMVVLGIHLEMSLVQAQGFRQLGGQGDHPADAIFSSRNINQEITLVDSTRINSFDEQRPFWRLYLYNEEGKWVLEMQTGRFFFSVKHPGEEEYRKYRSITFERDWGNFISGVPFEEDV